MRQSRWWDLEQARKNYDEDGAVCLRSVVDTATIERLAQAIEHFRSNPVGRFNVLRGSDGDGEFFMANYLAEHDRVIRDFVLNGTLPALAKALTGARQVRFFYDQLFAKYPGSQSPTPWHNDEPFWPLSGNQTISMWLALNPVNEHSGGLEYVRGSHLWDKRYRPVRPGEEEVEKDDGMVNAPDFDRPELRAKQEMLRWDMAPGDVLCHHPLAVHGAAGNTGSTIPRIGLSVRYFGEDAVWNPHVYSMPMPRSPKVSAGQYPDDDLAFPVVA